MLNWRFRARKAVIKSGTGAFMDTTVAAAWYPFWLKCQPLVQVHAFSFFGESVGAVTSSSHLKHKSTTTHGSTSARAPW